MTTLTSAELTRLGYRVVDGRAIRDQLTDTPDPDVTWQEMQSLVYRVFVDAGATVYWLSQARRTGQTAGLPDLLIFGPPGHPWHAAWETKAGKGKLSDAQRKFELHCQRTGFAHGSGGQSAARTFLKAMNAMTENGKR